MKRISIIVLATLIIAGKAWADDHKNLLTTDQRVKCFNQCVENSDCASKLDRTLLGFNISDDTPRGSSKAHLLTIEEAEQTIEKLLQNDRWRLRFDHLVSTFNNPNVSIGKLLSDEERRQICMKNIKNENFHEAINKFLIDYLVIQRGHNGHDFELMDFKTACRLLRELDEPFHRLLGELDEPFHGTTKMQYNAFIQTILTGENNGIEGEFKVDEKKQRVTAHVLRKGWDQKDEPTFNKITSCKGATDGAQQCARAAFAEWLYKMDEAMKLPIPGQ